MHEFVAASQQTAVAAAAVYRHFGDDSALLIVVVPAHGSELPGDARLLLGDGGSVAACAVTFQPDAGLARLVFAVERGVASGAGSALEVEVGPDVRLRVPEAVKRPAIGVPDAELDHAVAAGVAGDELAGLLRVLERRATIAERVARDSRETRSDATKLAQAYREIWEVRDLLESREEAYRRSAEAVEAAEAAQREAEAQTDAARAELDDVRSESQAATTRLEAELAAGAAEVERLRDELAAAGTRATDAEALLEAERTLHEARLAARDGTDRQLGALFAEAQRERLRQTPLDEQRAQVEALERQLARMKQPASGTDG